MTPRKTCPKCAAKLIYDENAVGRPEFFVEGKGDAARNVFRAICSGQKCTNNRHKFAVKARR